LAPPWVEIFSASFFEIIVNPLKVCSAWAEVARSRANIIKATIVAVQLLLNRSIAFLLLVPEGVENGTYRYEATLAIDAVGRG
jgi:hypothetical protein